MPKLVICSKTQMSGDRFCSCVMNPLGAQFRIFFPQEHLSASFLKKHKINPDDWRIRRLVMLDFLHRRPGIRTTHPEDSLFNPNTIVLAEMIDNGTFLETIRKITKISPTELFGVKPLKINDRPVIDPNNNTQASVGYVAAKTVSFYMDFDKWRAIVKFSNDEEMDLPVKCIELLKELNLPDHKRARHVTAVRLGLTNPFQPPRGDYDKAYCFLQLTGIVP